MSNKPLQNHTFRANLEPHVGTRLFVSWGLLDLSRTTHANHEPNERSNGHLADAGFVCHLLHNRPLSTK